MHLVRPFIAKKYTRLRKAIPVEKSVVITLSRMLTENNELRLNSTQERARNQKTLKRKGSKHVAIKSLSFKIPSKLPLESRLV